MVLYGTVPPFLDPEIPIDKTHGFMGFMMKHDGSMGIWHSMTIMMNGVFWVRKNG